MVLGLMEGQYGLGIDSSLGTKKKLFAGMAGSIKSMNLERCMKTYGFRWMTCILIATLSLPIYAKNWNLTPQEKEAKQQGLESFQKFGDGAEARLNPLKGVDPPTVQFWDGTYVVVFETKNNVCKKPLTVELSITVKNLDFTGSIKNLGRNGDFKNKACTKFHNGAVQGSLNRDGTFAKFDITHLDDTDWRSFVEATGSLIQGTLVSTNLYYHPDQVFSFVNTYEVTQRLLAAKKAANESSPWFSNDASDTRKVSQRLASGQTTIQKRSSPFTTGEQAPTADRSVEVTGSVSLNEGVDPKEAIEEIDLKITLYSKISNNLPQTDQGYRIQQEVLDKKISELKKLRESLAASYLSAYNTPIYPVNINLGTTAFRYAEIFPSIPYYIPGTKEVGEFLVQPVVSDTGQLTYEFTFLDPSARFNKQREQIVVVNTDMRGLIDGLDKVREWTETAEQQNVRRRYEKVAACFPQSDCGQRQIGKSSTEVVFQIYEDGSTAGKLQRV